MGQTWLPSHLRLQPRAAGCWVGLSLSMYTGYTPKNGCFHWENKGNLMIAQWMEWGILFSDKATLLRCVRHMIRYVE